MGNLPKTYVCRDGQENGYRIKKKVSRFARHPYKEVKVIFLSLVLFFDRYNRNKRTIFVFFLEFNDPVGCCENSMVFTNSNI